MTDFVKIFFDNKKVHYGDAYIDIYLEKKIHLPVGWKNPKNI